MKIALAIASLALLAAGSAKAQNYRSLDNNSAMALFAEEGSLSRAEMHASVRILLVYATPTAGNVARKMTFSIDCGAMTFAVGEQISFNANLAETARRMPFDAPMTVEPGTFPDTAISYACRNVTKPGSSIIRGLGETVAAGVRMTAAGPGR